MKKLLSGLMIFYVCLLYLCALLVILGLIIYHKVNESVGNTIIKVWFGVGFFSLIYGIIFSIASIAICIINNINLTKLTCICKFILIPFFIMNFVFWCCLSLGFLNPFLILGLLILIPFAIFSTFINMISTGIPNIVLFIKHYKENNNNLLYAAIAAGHFFFCLDVVCSVVAIQTQKQLSTKEE